MNTTELQGGKFTYLLLFISAFLFTSFQQVMMHLPGGGFVPWQKGADLNNSKCLRSDLIPNPTLINPAVPFFAS